jgi:hypothetical protein
VRIKEFGGTPPLDALAHRQSPALPNATEQIDAARMSARRCCWNDPRYLIEQSGRSKWSHTLRPS